MSGASTYIGQGGCWERERTGQGGRGESTR